MVQALKKKVLSRLSLEEIAALEAQRKIDAEKERQRWIEEAAKRKQDQKLIGFSHIAHDPMNDFCPCNVCWVKRHGPKPSISLQDRAHKYVCDTCKRVLWMVRELSSPEVRKCFKLLEGATCQGTLVEEIVRPHHENAS